MVERQTENLKVESSILFTDTINQFLVLYQVNRIQKKRIYAEDTCLKIQTKSLLYFFNFFKKKVYNEYYDYQQHNLYYLKNIFNVNLKEKNINCEKILPFKLRKFILYKTRNIHYKRFRIKYFNKIIYMILISV